PAGNEFRKGRFAVAVRTQQGDAVVIVDPEVYLLEDRLSWRVADSAALDRHDRRCWLLFRLGEGDRLDMRLDDGRHRAHALQRLDAALRLLGLGGLGLEAVDEALQMLSRRL